MGEYGGGSASAISASSPRPALKEKCLAADRRVHSPRVVSAGILSGILMARRDGQRTRICALNSREDLNPPRGNKPPVPPAVNGAVIKYCRQRQLKSNITSLMLNLSMNSLLFPFIPLMQRAVN